MNIDLATLPEDLDADIARAEADLPPLAPGRPSAPQQLNCGRVL